MRFCKLFETETEANAFAGDLNRSAGEEVAHVVDGPEDNFAVLDTESAAELLDDLMVGAQRESYGDHQERQFCQG